MFHTSSPDCFQADVFTGRGVTEKWLQAVEPERETGRGLAVASSLAPARREHGHVSAP